MVRSTEAAYFAGFDCFVKSQEHFCKLGGREAVAAAGGEVLAHHAAVE